MSGSSVAPSGAVKMLRLSATSVGLVKVWTTSPGTSGVPETDARSVTVKAESSSLVTIQYPTESRS